MLGAGEIEPRMKHESNTDKTPFRSANPNRPCRWGCALAFGILLFGASVPLSGEDLKATLDDGTVLHGHLRGKTARELRFFVKEKSQTLFGVRRITGRAGSPVLNNDRPARVFHLAGGGTITGELVDFNDSEITLSFRGSRVTLPREAVLAIDPFLGDRQEIYDGFGSAGLSPIWKRTGAVAIRSLENRSAVQLAPGASLMYSPETPLAGARWSAAFFEPGPERLAADIGLELLFGESRVTIISASAEPFYTVHHSPYLRLTKQPVRKVPGWRRLTVLFDKARFQVLVDSHLLATGRPPADSLQSVRLFSPPAERGSPPVAWFDDVLLSELVPEMAEQPPISFDPQDQAVLAGGDVLLGKVLDIDAHRVRLSGGFGETALPWDRLRRIVFSENAQSLDSTVSNRLSPLGWSAEVTFRHWADHPYQPGDRLRVKLLSADAEALVMFHLWLGQVTIPWSQIDAIEPEYLGRSQILSPAARHLGNQFRPAFRHKKPMGTTWQGEFSLKERSGSAFLRIEVAELEPAGPDTPPASRFLSELRQGHLGTEVFLNGESLGRLNDRISARSPSPAILRLAIPANLLRPGKNAWRIEQHPLSHQSKEFDDCELGPITLQIEETNE